MKRNTIISVIFIITTIVASVIAIYVNVNSKNNIEQLKTEISSLKNEIENTTISEDKVEDNNESNIVSENEAEDIDESDVTIDTKVENKNTIIKFDPTKVVNSSKEYADKSEYTVYISTATYYNVTIENGNLKIVLVQNNGTNTEISTNQINEKIVDILGGWTGDGASGYIAFLTENGNVYLSDNIYNNNQSLTLTKVENVSNICKLQFATAYVDITRGDKSWKNPYKTIVAIDSNGNSYDLIFKD